MSALFWEAFMEPFLFLFLFVLMDFILQQILVCSKIEREVQSSRIRLSSQMHSLSHY